MLSQKIVKTRFLSVCYHCHIKMYTNLISTVLCILTFGKCLFATKQAHYICIRYLKNISEFVPQTLSYQRIYLNMEPFFENVNQEISVQLMPGGRPGPIARWPSFARQSLQPTSMTHLDHCFMSV
jgi:hypothetical protein